MNMQYKKIKNDIYGNPRYVIHFMKLLTQNELDSFSGLDKISKAYALAIKKAKKLGGKAYHGKDFGGGIVFKSFNIESTIKDIVEVKNV